MTIKAEAVSSKASSSNSAESHKKASDSPASHKTSHEPLEFLSPPREVVCFRPGAAQQSSNHLPFAQPNAIRLCIHKTCEEFGAIQDMIVHVDLQAILVKFQSVATAIKVIAHSSVLDNLGLPWFCERPTSSMYTNIIDPDLFYAVVNAEQVESDRLDYRQHIFGEDDALRRQAAALLTGDRTQADYIIRIYEPIPDKCIDFNMSRLASDLNIRFHAIPKARRSGKDFAELFVTVEGVHKRMIDLGTTYFDGRAVHILAKRPKI